MPHVPAEQLRVESDATGLVVWSPFWTVRHDRHRGGVPTEIRFTHGLPGNVLAAPLETRVDELTDVACRHTRLTHGRRSDGVTVVCEGYLAERQGRASAIRFRTVYAYTSYTLRREVSLQFPAGSRARIVAPLRAALDVRFEYYSAARDPHTDTHPDSVLGPGYFGYIQPLPRTPGDFFRDAWPPGWVTFLRAGGEALQVTPCGDLGFWEAPAGVAAVGRHTLRRGATELRLGMDVLHAPRPVALPRRLVFAANLDLLNLPATHPAPLRAVMVGNPPFPADRLLGAWARHGVELVMIMEGTRWLGRRDDLPGGTGFWRPDTDRYWRMGAYTPYRDAADRRDLRRLVTSAHRLGMKVVPYTAPAEINPELPAFGRHFRQWRQQTVPGGGTVYHPTGNYPGAVWGALVCPDCPGVRRYYLGFVKRYLHDYGFDGIYVDLASKVYCHNTAHGPARHGGIDGLWDALRRAREFMGPDKLLVAHNGDCNMMVALNNLADAAVTMEALNAAKQWRWDLRVIRPYIRAFPSCPVLMIPNYKWYWTGTKAARTAMADGIAKGALLGSVPFHLDLYFEPPKWGYRDVYAALRDPRGLWAMFRRLQALRLEGMHFDDCYSGTVRTNRRGVLGARYWDDQRLIVVLANLSDRTARNIRWRCGPHHGTVPTLHATEYQFVEVQ